MRVLGLDLGSTTGWAVAEEQLRIVASGTWDIAPRRGESSGCRYLHLRAHLNEALAAFDAFDLVIYEAAHHRGGHATEYAVGCVATVQAWCAQRDVEHASVHTATLKKYATGNGRADKAAMVGAAGRIACTSRLVAPASGPGSDGYLDDNEADAIHAARYGMERILGVADPPHPEAGA